MEERPVTSQESSENGVRFCTRCGRKLAADAAYCDGCGHPVSGRTAPKPDFVRTKTYAPEKISDIIGKERDYYNRRITELYDSDSHISWNWYACLGWYWYAYRKMPIEAAVCFLAYVFLGFFGSMGWLLRLCMLAASGALGNFIYLKHIERTIDRIDALPSNMRLSAALDYSGVSGLMLVIAFLISSMASGGIHLALWQFRAPLSILRRCLRMFFVF